jgi:hypothetical protein
MTLTWQVYGAFRGIFIGKIYGIVIGVSNRDYTISAQVPAAVFATHNFLCNMGML